MIENRVKQIWWTKNTIYFYFFFKKHMSVTCSLGAGNGVLDLPQWLSISLTKIIKKQVIFLNIDTFGDAAFE